MIRTQIYLTEDEREKLNRMSGNTGKPQSELIREAVDEYLAAAEGGRREAILRDAAGMWRNRVDLPDFGLKRRTRDRR